MKTSREEREANMVASRNTRVLEAALDIASESGITAITRDAVATLAGVSAGTVNNAYGTMDALRDEVMRQAVTRGIPAIIAQGLAMGSEIARAAPPDLREAAAATLTA